MPWSINSFLKSATLLQRTGSADSNHRRKLPSHLLRQKAVKFGNLPEDVFITLVGFRRQTQAAQRPGQVCAVGDHAFNFRSSEIDTNELHPVGYDES